jgi:hypothetical protein
MQNERALIYGVFCVEHIQTMKANKQNSKYAQHNLDTGHIYGTINETLETLFKHKSSRNFFFNCFIASLQSTSFQSIK